MAGPRSPFPLCYLDKVVGFLVPRSKASSPVPVPRPPFRFLVPRSGSSSPVPVPRSWFTDLSHYPPFSLKEDVHANRTPILVCYELRTLTVNYLRQSHSTILVKSCCMDMGNCFALRPHNKLQATPMYPVGADGRSIVPLRKRRRISRISRRSLPARGVFVGPFYENK